MPSRTFSPVIHSGEPTILQGCDGTFLPGQETRPPSQTLQLLKLHGGFRDKEREQRDHLIFLMLVQNLRLLCVSWGAESCLCGGFKPALLNNCR